MTTPPKVALITGVTGKRWEAIADCEGRWLRVVLLADGETVHNAFFDRRVTP